VREVLTYLIAFVAAAYMVRQVRKPTGLAGRFFLAMMNRSHSGVTTWGLEHVQVGDRDAILDVGCGGGRTIQRLAAMAVHGKVCGVDYAEASVAASRRLNQAEIQSGRVDVRHASVADLPFPDRSFDLVTAVETHFYWPDRPAAMRELFRVLKPGGRALIIAEIHGGHRFDLPYQLPMKLVGGACLTPDEHRDMFTGAGFAESQVFLERSKGWICATGVRP
jgi:SAM-dependent methyltransferase